jgi:putative ABC transport system ATP-binding protein
LLFITPQKPAENKLKTSQLKCLRSKKGWCMLGTMISVSHVSKLVGDVGGQLSILRDIDFSVNKGETVAILGASGSGKSTLLSIMAGLDTPSSGQVSLAGQSIFDLSEDDRAAWRGQQLGFVFQNFQLMGHLTALENVMLPLELSGTKEAFKLAQDILGQVGLSERMKHFPKVLSGGEQQRVALARAFVVQPKLLLADEPTGSLDAETGESIMNLMLAMNQARGTTLILVTHDQKLAQRCDRTLTLEAGQLISQR